MDTLLAWITTEYVVVVTWELRHVVVVGVPLAWSSGLSDRSDRLRLLVESLKNRVGSRGMLLDYIRVEVFLCPVKVLSIVENRNLRWLVLDHFSLDWGR